MKFATKLTQHYPPHLRHVGTLPQEIKNSNFWPPVNCARVPQRFYQLINATLCPAFLRKFVCQPVCCVPLQIQTFFIKILSLLLNTMLIIDKRCSDICGDEFSMPQIHRKSKYPKEQWHKNLFAVYMGKDIQFLSTENIKICGRTTKLEANALYLHILPYWLNICRNLNF